MSVDGRDERVIEIDPDDDHVRVTGSRPVPRFVPVIMALIVGVLIGSGTADIAARAKPLPAPALVMHTVIVTEDGRSQTLTMPGGTLVTTTAVHNSCSITVDGKFVAFLSGIVGNAECGATIR